jgi:hypothetical protein
MERAGKADMGQFLPSYRPEPEPVSVAPAVPEASAAPAPAPASSDVASELAAMRAEVAALQRQAQPAPEPEAVPAPEPATPANPLEAHARTVLGPGAQPKHVARAVTLLEQAMQWDAFSRHHEANPTATSAGELAKAQRAREAIDREIDGLSEIAALHAQQAELRAELAKSKQPDPEALAKQRSERLDAAFSSEALAQYHPHLASAIKTNPVMRKLVVEKLMALPYDATFDARGDAILHALNDELVPTEAAPVPVAATPAPVVTRAPAPKPPAPRAPVAPPPAEQPILTRQQWREQLANQFAARSRN